MAFAGTLSTLTSIFDKLDFTPAQEDHRRVLAVLTYVRADPLG